MVVPADPQPVVTFPKSSTNKDIVTPHKIALLALIKEFCHVRKFTLCKRPLQNVSESNWEHTSAQNRAFAVTMLKLIQNPDMDLKRLINIIHPELHERTYQAFLERLQSLICEDVDTVGIMSGKAALWDFIPGALDSLLVEPCPVLPVVQRSSVLGLFIRRMILAFDKLSFSQQSKLCTKFRAYYDAAFAANIDESLDVCMTGNTGDESPSESEDDENLVFASQKQAEFFIAQQAKLIEINESEALNPYDLQQKLTELVKGNPDLYEACYLTYLNCMRVKEYSGAKSSIYHHFDRFATLPSESRNANTTEDFSRSSRYACLLRAMLHALFGQPEQCVVALNEAIMIAQEVNDHVCLQHCLTWLYRTVDERKEPLIQRAIARSSELGLWSLSSLAIQALAKEKSITSVQPASIFELLTQSDVQNCQYSMTDLCGPALAMRAGLWAYYGHEAMMQLSSQMLLFMNTSDPIRGGVYHTSESTCIALRNVATGLAGQGYFKESVQILKLAKKLFPSLTQYCHIWQFADVLINFNQALYYGASNKIRYMVMDLKVLDRHEGLYRDALRCFQSEYYDKCEDILRDLLTQCEKEDSKLSPLFHVKVLMLRASSFIRTPNYVNAMPMLMTCLDICRRHHLVLMEALVAIPLSRLQWALGLPSLGLRALDEAYFTIFTHGSLYDKATWYFAYAETLFELVYRDWKKSNTYQKKDVNHALSFSSKALEIFTKAMARYMMQLVYNWQAYVYNFLGNKKTRNHVSALGRELGETDNFPFEFHLVYK